MRILRDKSFSAQIIILYELYTGEYSKLSPIAEKIGVTQQAISNYMKKMKKQNLVHKVDGKYRPTINGTYVLQTELLKLKKFVDERTERIPLVKNCIAIAKTPINAGDSVGLFMDDGWLVGYANKKSPSIGLADFDADVEDYVQVGNLEGIIDHRIGKVYFFKLSNRHSESSHLNVESLQRNIGGLNVDRVGILDVVGRILCDKLNIKPDFEFGVIYAAIDAAQRGLNTVVFGLDEKLEESIELFEKINEKNSEKIEFELLSAK